MRRSWQTYSMIFGLAVLLVLLGGLQYRWLTTISATESEKAHQRVKEQTERFAQDFNREIQNAYFNFQTDSEPWKQQNWNAFNERYDFWKKNSAYPGLITDFYFVASQPGIAALKYDAASATFVQEDDNDEIAALRTRIADEKTFKAVDTNSYTLLLPIHEPPGKVERVMMRSPVRDVALRERTPGFEMPKRYGYLAIKLDPAVIKDGILADLSAKYFGDGEYKIGVTDSSGQAVVSGISSGDPDATARLMDLTPDNLIFFSNKDTMSAIGGEKKFDTKIISSHVESHTINNVGVSETPGGEVSSMKIEVTRSDKRPRTSIFTTTADNDSVSPWTLTVQHSSGSLDGFIASTLRRNLAFGFGILFLLAGAVAAIIISSMRVRAFAQRQLDFVSSVSHEFRTPLAVIYSAGENLADGVAKETVQVSRYGDLIKGEGRKLSAMVEQILEFAGANSGKRKFNFSPTVVGDVVNSAVDESRSLIDDRGFDIETSIADGLPMISADRTALSQAIQNLIANSIKYCNGKAWLRVTASNGDGKIKIAVEDHGIGISKGDLRQIFEPFFRSKEVVDAQIHGNGLGLSLVKQIVEAHGGSVKAESEVGKGSKFTIEIPS